MYVMRGVLRNFSSLKQLISNKDFVGAVSYLEKQTSTVPVEDLNFLMTRLYSAGKHNEAYKLLLILPSVGKTPDELDYTLSIEVCLQQNKIIQALNIFYQAQLFGIVFDACLYSNLLIACTKEVGTRNIKWILNCMQKDQVLVSIHACISVIRNGIMMKDHSLIESVLKVMFQAGYEYPSRLINNFISKNISDSNEYKSLKNYWSKVQQHSNSYEQSFEMDKTFDPKEHIKSDSKNPLSFELVLLPKDNHKQLELDESSSADEESGSD